MFEVSHELVTRIMVDEISLSSLTRIQCEVLAPRFNVNIEFGVGKNIPPIKLNSAPRFRNDELSVPGTTNTMVLAALDNVRNSVNLHMIPTKDVKIEICWASSEKIIIIKTNDYSGSSGAKYRILLTGSPTLSALRRVSRSRKIKEIIAGACRAIIAFCIA